MTGSVSKQRVFAPTYPVGANVTKQRVFVTIHVPGGVNVTKQRVFLPIYYDASLLGARRKQVMVGSF